MISTAPKLTTAGTSLLIRALAGEAVTFTGFKIGNGDPPDDPSALTDLVNPLMSFGIDSLDRDTPGQVVIRGRFDNSEVTESFRVKEFGIFAQGEAVREYTSAGAATFTIPSKPLAVNSVTVEDEPATVSSYDPETGVVTLDSAPTSGDIVRIRYPDGTNLLYAYTNDGDAAGLIRAYATDVVSEETVIVCLEISSEANITAYLTPEAAYVLQSDFDAHLAATNPHGISPSAIGLGNVDNVHLDDYTPTFTEASTLTNIESGSTFSVLFGRIKKAISTLISHINNKNNPHKVTYTQAGAAKAEHTHSAVDINAGVLPLQRGGTGVSTLGELRALMGAAVSGCVEGNGQNKRHIDLGFQPSAVIYSSCRLSHPVGLIALPGHNAVTSDCTDAEHESEWHQPHTLLMIDETGFFVSGSSSVTGEYTNRLNYRYNYVAFR